MNQEELVLQNLFLYLVREGFPLGVRDYQDALKALRLGYGLHRRDGLLRLCRTLWARTEEEKRYLDSLFKQFQQPTEEEVAEIAGASDPDAPPVLENPSPSSDDQPLSAPDKTNDEARPAPSLEFDSSNDRKGIGLPSAKIPPREEEYFILSPRQFVSLRRLIIIWRRYKLFKRDGPKTELDLEATIREKCRHGIISEPVLVPGRRNLVKLVVLIDVSASMTPWQSFNEVLVDSLRRGELGEAAVYYFHNVPDEVLYEKESLIQPKFIDDVLKRHEQSALLIVSDAGAARGFRNRLRAAETKNFLKGVSHRWHPAVWLNPMPPARWPGTTAEMIKKSVLGKMYELSEDGLIKSIDVLRGKRIS